MDDLKLIAKSEEEHQKQIQTVKTFIDDIYMEYGLSEGIQHQQMKERLKQEYSTRLRIILKSELNARNKITAIGALAVPVLRYSFGIINWRTEEIKKKKLTGILERC